MSDHNEWQDRQIHFEDEKLRIERERFKLKSEEQALSERVMDLAAARQVIILEAKESKALVLDGILNRERAKRSQVSARAVLSAVTTCLGSAACFQFESVAFGSAFAIICVGSAIIGALPLKSAALKSLEDLS